MTKNIRIFITLFFFSALIGGLIAGFSYYTNQYAPQTSAAQARVAITLTPSSLQLAVGEVKTITALIQPFDPNNTMSGIDLTFTGGGQVGIVDVSSPASFPEGDTSLFTQIVRSIQPSQSRISYVVTRPSDQLPHAAQITITVQGLADGTGTIGIDSASAQIVGKVEGYAYEIDAVQPVTVQVGQINQISPTGANPTDVVPSLQPTTGSGQVNLLLKMRLQGVVKRPVEGKGSMKVKVKLVQNTVSNAAMYEVPMTYEEPGIWTGRITVAEQPGSGYYLLVKGPFHLQKKICDTHPVLTNGVYSCKGGSISLIAGDNIIDLTGIFIPVGDLKMDGQEQDGFVNSSDVSFIRDHMGNATALDSADLNLDGIVDTQDYALVIETLSSKHDEDE